MAYVPHICPTLSSNFRPAVQRIVDECHYTYTRRTADARCTADLFHRPQAGFPTGIVKTRAGSAMVHVAMTLRLAPTHPFLKSSSTKVSQLARREFREFFTETTST